MISELAHGCSNLIWGRWGDVAARSGRGVVAGLALTAAPLTALGTAKSAYAQPKQSIPDKSLYERLGGVFAIATVVDHFSDAVVKNPIVGQKSKNSQLREWHTSSWEGCPASSSCERWQRFG